MMLTGDVLNMFLRMPSCVIACGIQERVQEVEHSVVDVGVSGG